MGTGMRACLTVRCGAVRCGAVRCGAVRCYRKQYSACDPTDAVVQHDAVPFDVCAVAR